MDCGRRKGEPCLLSWDLDGGVLYLQIMAFGKPRNQKRKLRREDTSRCVKKSFCPRPGYRENFHPPPGCPSQELRRRLWGLTEQSRERDRP